MFYTIGMKANSSDRPESPWQKTPVANLVRHVQSGNYYARIRVRGKLIWKSLKTDRISVAKLRLGDFHKEQRQRAAVQTAVARGKMTFGDAVTVYEQKLLNDPNLKPKTREYYSFRIKALLASWPDLENTDVSKISRSDCETWSLANAKAVSSSSHNHTVSLVRQVFQTTIEAGARYDNPGLAAKRVKEQTIKQIKLPESSQFEKLVEVIKSSGSGFAKPSAELVQFLAYGGFRKTEASHITWGDCDFAAGKIIVRGSPETGLKGRKVGENRVVPMILEMRQLLEKIKNGESPEPSQPVMQVFECKKSITTACKKLGIPRFTHHDLRHLFATRCIESGVDIPTVSRWLGHRDGGALAMKVYGHLRDQHSTNMAKKVVFSETATAVVSAVPPEPKTVQPVNGENKKSIAQTKAKYAYPWWASDEAIEVFLGQANEPVQIVPKLQYLEASKQAMRRKVFEKELAKPQALIEELTERVGAATIEELKYRLQPHGL